MENNSTIIDGNSNQNLMITSKELIFFLCSCVIMLIFGIYLWNFIWIKEYGGTIPNVQYRSEDLTTFFNTKNYKIFLSEFFKKFNEFEKKYLIRSVGTEAYIYLIFQKTILKLIFTMTIISLIISLISTLSLNEKGIRNFIHDLLLNNKQMNDFNSFLHLIGVIIYSFLHFRYFSQIKREARNIYFEKFDMLSRKKDFNWLSSRTLHISGLAPHERNTSILKKKLDIFLNSQKGGEVIDIQFIPNYQSILELEMERNELNDLKNLINKKENSIIRKYFFPRIYRKDQRILKQIDEIDSKMQKEIENPVVSSGHAFICFDSLLSANKCLYIYKEGFCKKLKLKMEYIWDSIKSIGRMGQSRSFTRFKEDELDIEILEPEKIKILVDQMMEPYDIIWTNVGGDRGIYVLRQIIIYCLVFITLLFLTTPTSLFSTLKSFDYLNFFEFNWIIKIPYGYILKTYLPPLTILLLNLILIFLIDVSALIEKHYTHSRFQYSVFTKSFFYMLLNIIIIPGLTLSTANSFFDLFKSQINNIPELLSKLFITNSGYFFVTLIIQNGTISPLFYILRLDELFINRFSSFFAFYKRHFANVGKQWHRKEGDIFQYGYFYAQMLTFYTICLVFSSTVPLILIASLYFFFLRRISDFYSLLCIHRMEIESSGYIINRVVNFSNIPVLFYQISMLSFFIIKQKYNDAIITSVIFIASMIYAINNSDPYILDIYSLHDSLKAYDNGSGEISQNDLNKWRNKFKHPLVLPIHLEDDTLLIPPSRFNQTKNAINLNMNNTVNEFSQIDNVIMIKDELNLREEFKKF